MIKDLTGRKFGRLTVTHFISKTDKHTWWSCRCVCGNEKTVIANNLKRGLSLSCGCLRIIHGESPNDRRTRTYRIWANMMDRCEWGGNKRSWKAYGGRGIRVCSRWHNYENFRADMGTSPHNKTLDRINNDGNYEPSNCRWATSLERRDDSDDWGRQGRRSDCELTDKRGNHEQKRPDRRREKPDHARQD